jgi:hypothetical protein
MAGGTEQSRMTKNQNDRIGELEIELKQRDARIIELTEERDKEQKLNEESRDNSDRWDAAFDAWKKRLGLLSGSLP